MWEQVLLTSAKQQPARRNQPLGQAGATERAGLGGGGRKGRSVQSLTIFVFWEGWEGVKFPVGKKRMPTFSRAERWKLHLGRARLVSVNEPDPESPTHPWPNFLEAPSLKVRTKPGSRLPPSRSLMGGLFLSPFECSGHHERPHHFHVLTEPLMNGIGTAHRQSHRIPPWSPNPSSQRDMCCRVYFTQ